MSDDSEEHVDELKTKRICVACVGDTFLKVEIANDGTDGGCDYCDGKGKSITLEELADHVECAFERHYHRTSTEPSGFQYSMMKESDYDWSRDGDQVDYAIGEAAEIDEEPSRHVRLILEDRHYDFDNAKMGEESEFAEDSYYERKDVRDHEFQEAWRFFEAQVKGAERHFNSSAERTLSEIFGDLNAHRTADGRSTIVEAGPDTDIKAYYRARVFQSSATLEHALRYPDREIGPPPMAQALAGRMNARGVSVFYGATDPGTAIAEVRPPVGSRVVVGRFELLRPVRLLDVLALKDVVVDGSVFDPSFIGRLERAKFLERLSDRISMPVMPHDETLDYIVTQVIADYLATREDPVVDGILFPSPQQHNGGSNLVLFHKSSAVLPEVLPPGSKINSTLGWNSEEGFDVDYRVWEEVPKPNDDKSELSKGFPNFGDLIGVPIEPNYDCREPTLKLDTSNLSVHHINAVAYDTSPHKVSRHRIEKDEPKPSATTPKDDLADLL